MLIGRSLRPGAGKRFGNRLFKALRSALPALLLAACSRPLTENEARFAGELFGDSLDPAEVRVRVGAGITPLPAPAPAAPEQGARADIPEGFCTRIPQPRKIRWPAAFVLGNSVFFKREYYAADTFPGWPDSFLMPQGLIMVHELTHVWQWQNRATTHYSPLRPLAEAARKADPYIWDQTGPRPFQAYGFEQQAALIEDYLCYRLFESTAPRLDELRAILAPVLPLQRLEAALR